MFWKRRKRPPETPSPEPPPVSDEGGAALAERGLDTVAGLLRSFGEQAFDLDEIEADDTREACERWARHVLVGSPAEPRHQLVEARGEDDGEESAGESGRPPVRRDFRGLIHFFGSRRGHEHRYVTQSLADLRQAIWMMIQGLRETVTEDRRADALASIHLRRLGAAVEGSSTQKIRREARECVRIIGELIDERQRRQRDQIEDLATRVREMRRELEVAWQRTTRDALTGLGNRAAFDEQIERVVDVSFLFSESAFLFMIDIDHFKWVNDRFGHPGGDEVLRRVGACLAGSFLRKNDFVARYGGEEFAAVVRVDDEELARRVADRVMFAVRDLLIDYEGQEIRVSASIGIAGLVPGEDAAGWIRRADAALYRAKEAGRDRAVFAEG